MMRISFAVLAAVAVFAAACMSGDDDDDDGYECDFGQHENQWGPNSPVQECVYVGGGTDSCMRDMAPEEIEWRCECAPDSCQRWKDLYDYWGVEY